MELPTGTVTFLFTDIEASSHLWEADPEGMKQALAWHDALLEGIIQSHQGTVFKQGGDSFCAVFQTASSALIASIEIQKKLTSEQPDGLLPLKVRIAIHTGVAEVRNNDYFGNAVNRVARILSAGYGGQILLSQVSEALCEDTYSAGIQTVDLGEVILKTMTKSERIFQVVIPGLPSVFPPLKVTELVSGTNDYTSFADMDAESETTRKILERAQSKSGSVINRDALLKAAAELGIPASAVAQAESEFRQEDENRTLRALYLSQRRAASYQRGLGMLSTVFLLTVIWFITDRHDIFWPAIVAGGLFIGFLKDFGPVIKDGPHLDQTFETWKLKRQMRQKGISPSTELLDGTENAYERRMARKRQRY